MSFLTNPFKNPHFSHFNQTIWAMLIGGFLVKVTYFMSWPFLIVILNSKLAISPVSVGVILGFSSALSAILGLYIGHLSDKFGRKVVMITGCVIMALSFLLLLSANSFWEFFVIMALMGIGSPSIEIVTKAVISENLPDIKVREFALHLRYFLINVAGAIGALMGLYVGLKNPNVLFMTTSIAYVAYILWIFKLIKPIKTNHQNTLPNFRQTVNIIRHDFLFLLLLIANFLMLIVYSQFNATLPQIMTLSLAEKATQLIVLLGVVNCGTVVLLQFPLLNVLQKFAIARRSQIGIGLMLISQLLFIGIDKHSMWAWGVVFFILSVGETIVFPTINVNIDQMAKPELRGSYFGASNLSGFGSSFGPILGGFIIGQWNDTAYFMVTTFLCLFSILLYQTIYQKQKALP